jgi:hypothetical protein
MWIVLLVSKNATRYLLAVVVMSFSYFLIYLLLDLRSRSGLGLSRVIGTKGSFSKDDGGEFGAGRATLAAGKTLVGTHAGVLISNY